MSIFISFFYLSVHSVRGNWNVLKVRYYQDFRGVVNVF